MITAFRANTPLMIFRQTSLVSNSYGSTTVTAPPCTAGSLRLTSGAGTALELGRPKSATLSESRQGLVVLAHRECQHHSPVDREARVQTRERLIHISLVAILSFSDITVEFGATTLFSGVTFTVAAGERWGIVGRNGAGKTTLFRLITGALQPEAGVVSRAGALRIAVLDQHGEFGNAATVWDAAAIAYAEVRALEAELARQGEELAALGDAVTQADLARYGHEQERFTHLGGYGYHARVDAVLQGLGFDPEAAKVRPLSSLSGGERGRIGLAGPLAAPADLVLLDEPTNHLDLDTTRWLTRWVTQLEETVLII